MQLIRTTLRLNEALKKEAERLALEQEKTLQDIFNDALERYLAQKARKEATKIRFRTHRLGAPLDRLTRADYYR